MALYVSTFDENTPSKCKALWGVNEGLLFDCASPCGPYDNPFELGYFHLTSFDCEQYPPNPQGYYYDYTYVNQIGERVNFASLTEPVIQLVTDQTLNCDISIYGSSKNRTIFSFTGVELGQIREIDACGAFTLATVTRKEIQTNVSFI